MQYSSEKSGSYESESISSEYSESEEYSSEEDSEDQAINRRKHKKRRRWEFVFLLGIVPFLFCLIF